MYNRNSAFTQIVPGKEVMKQREMEGKRRAASHLEMGVWEQLQQLENWPLKDIWPKSLEPVDSKTKSSWHTHVIK